MPHYRAHHASASDARDAVGAAKTAIEAKWSAATAETGVAVETVSPTVAVRIESTEDIPALAALPITYTNAKMRIASIDGRAEYITATMPKTQADALISAASGTFTATSTKKSQALAKSRVAKSIQVFAMDAVAAVLTGLKVQDLNTGKQYTCSTYTASAAGAHTVDVTETDPTDTNDVTHGTQLHFLAAPSNIIPIASVNAMKGFTVSPSQDMLDASGRAYITNGSAVLADSGISLFGDHTKLIDVVRDVTDGLEYETSLEVDDEITFVTPVTNVATAAVVTRTGGASVAAGAILTRVVFGVTYSYEVITATAISDALFAYVPFKASILGPTANRDVGDVLTFTVTPDDCDTTAAVATSVAAAAYPEPYASQVIGGEVEWSTRVYRDRDGRWTSELFTLPEGS